MAGAQPPALRSERSEAACAFLASPVSWFSQQNVRIERVMTDNGSAFVSRAFEEQCMALGIRHKRIRPHRPLDERQGRAVHSDAATYESSAERKRRPRAVCAFL